MDTITVLFVGVLATFGGVLVTLAVSRHYFRRTMRKSIGIYRLLDTRIFAGIDRAVREQLRFTYQDREVEDLLQLEFVIANDGERAISNVIEPLRLDLPQGVEVLDASVLHRHPENLNVSITTVDRERSTNSILFEFPLLNKGDFFLVKLLLSGELGRDDFLFEILADDLPRSLSTLELLPMATRVEERKYTFGWEALFSGLVVAGIVAWIGWALSLLYDQRPELFPHPWASYPITIESVFLLVPAVVLIGVFGFLALFAIGISFFGGFPPKGPRFPIPKGILSKDFRYPFPMLPEITIADPRRGEAQEKKAEPPNKRL